MNLNKRDLTLHDPNAKIVVSKRHLEAIEYLLASNVRHERTSSEEHSLHLKNASEVITMALKVDARRWQRNWPK